MIPISVPCVIIKSLIHSRNESECNGCSELTVCCCWDRATKWKRGGTSKKSTQNPSSNDQATQAPTLTQPSRTGLGGPNKKIEIKF